MIFGRISNMFWGLEDMRNAVTRFDYFISEQANIEAFAFESMIFPSMVTMVQTILRQSGFVSRLRWPVGVNGKHSSALFNSDSPRESHLNCLGLPVFPQSSDNPVWVRFCWLCIKQVGAECLLAKSQHRWPIYVSTWGTQNSNRLSRFFSTKLQRLGVYSIFWWTQISYWLCIYYIHLYPNQSHHKIHKMLGWWWYKLEFLASETHWQYLVVHPRNRQRAFLAHL